jgi:hypothetical protein
MEGSGRDRYFPERNHGKQQSGQPLSGLKLPETNQVGHALVFTVQELR